MEVYAAKGHILFELEQFEDAINTYEKLVAVSPRHVTAQFNLGICYEKLGRWQESVIDLEYALPVLEARRTVHAALAEAYTGLGSQDLAAQHQRLAKAVARANP